jgi:acetyl esterase/lipase
MKSLALFAMIFTVATLVCAGAGLEALKPHSIWPKGAPGDTTQMDERDTTKPADNLIAGRRIIKLAGVTNPTITVYPPKGKNTGAAVLVFPGGGYNILAMDLEGTEVCEWLSSVGITGVLLKYRVPARPGTPREGAPLQDAQRAIRLVRSNAAQLGVDPKKIGALGFSAGAHLAAHLSNQSAKRTYEPLDAADAADCRPDFVALIYPGLLTEGNAGLKLSPEMTITANTPPTFLLQSEDDGVKVENSLLYYTALKAAKVPAEMHLFAKGGHGYGLRHTENPVTDWPKLAERWFQTLGVLPSR